MAEKLIGSLIYDDHPEPRKARPWKERLKVPVSIGLIFLVAGGLLYKFVNYREEARVSAFLEAVAAGRYDEAYEMWDAGERYRMEHFLEDWGPDGYYTGDGAGFAVFDSNNDGPRVIVYAQSDQGVIVALMVDKETRLLSFSPENKYAR